jgi:phage tail-like protein
MTPQDSKSWLVGAGYPWRTLDSSNVRDDDSNGLFLIPTKPYEPPVLVVKACGSPSYKVEKSTYHIDRQEHQISVCTSDGKLRHRWGPQDDNSRHVPPTDPRAWDPVDLVVHNGCVLILDQKYQAVHSHEQGKETLSVRFRSSQPKVNWVRMEIDQSGCLLMFDSREIERLALVYDDRGNYLGKKKAAWPSSSTSQCVWLSYKIDRRERHVVVEEGEGNDRKQLHVWGARNESGSSVAPSDPRAWDPIDMAGDSSCTFILDQRYQIVYMHQYGREMLSLLCQSSKPASRWSRLAIDTSGWLMIFDDNETDALLFDRQGQFRGTKSANCPSPSTPFIQLRYKINYEQRRLTVENIEGVEKKQLHGWGPLSKNGSVVLPTDPDAWDPIELAGDDNYTFLLDQRYQTVYKHQYGQATLSLLCQSSESGSQWSRIAMDPSGRLLIFDARKREALLYDRHGEFRGTKKVDWPAPPPVRIYDSGNQLLPYFNEGSWLSETLDSSIYNCQWHRIRMAVKHLPPGTEVDVKTFAYQREDMAPVRADDPRFTTALTLVAPTQPSPTNRSQKRVEEFLIQSGPGQYISVAIQLRGDGFGTPIISSLRVEFPRESYLEYLPPLYSAVEPMRSFLERFLSIFQAEWDEFDRHVEESEAFFDPQAVPEGVAMVYLASWLGLDLEGTWNGRQNRQLLNEVPKIFPRRGTVQALRDYVGVYLANIAGLTTEQVKQSQFPAIVEGFRERQYLMLSEAGGSTLGTTQPLWSPAIVRRLQLGGFSRVGEVELVSTGEPELDLFHHFAHRFRVYVPAAWIRTAAHEQLLRRAIQAEMPAHAKYDLCLVEAGLRVGIQSTVGLDTIVGDPPSFQLSCEPEKQASSLPPRNQLGLGAVLSGKGRGPAVLHSGARVGGWILN